MAKEIVNMNNPFSDLENKHQLNDLINYLISELNSKELNIWLPIDTKQDDVTVYNQILKIENILLGTVTWEEILSSANNILDRMKTVLQNLKSNKPDNKKRASILRQQIAKVRAEKESTHRLNPLRFLNNITVYANTLSFKEAISIIQFQLSQEHWDTVQREFRYRYYVWEELERLLYEELSEIVLDEFPEKVYKWNGSPINLTEVAFALVESGNISFDRTKTKDDFIRDFLAWFHVPGSSISRDKKNITDRKKGKNYLQELDNTITLLQKRP